MSIVLYGARAKGDKTSQSVYEFLVLSNNDTPLDKFILFNETVKLELLSEKYLNVNILNYTPKYLRKYYTKMKWWNILYMICRENIILYDRYGTFMSIKERMLNSKIKSEEIFLRQCIEFSKKIGSEKWVRKFDKTLMHYMYRNNRKRL